MSYRITQLHSLMLYEFTQVEGDIAGISDKALTLALPAGTTLSALRNNVERGEWALLTDTPNSALLEQAPDDDDELKWRINPTLENQLEPSARSAYNHRLKLVNESSITQASKSVSNDLGASTYYVPPVIEPEPSRLTPYERYKKTVAMQQKEIEDFWREKDARDAAKREKKRREIELAAQHEAVPDKSLDTATTNAGNVPDKISPVQPRVDVSQKFVKSELGSNAFEFKIGDPTKHGLHATVTKDGVLSFDIRANKELAGTEGSGMDMAASLMNRLQQEGIDVKQFDAVWQKGSKAVSTNYHSYNKNFRSVGELEAARNTWTGQFFAQHGFDIVEPPKIVNAPMKTYLASFVKVQP